MDPLITPALLTGGAQLLSGITSAFQSGSNTQQQIQASEQEQATQNKFTEMMSNTAYQRSTADMKAAGLNPMMMYGSGGGPASVPSGSSIQAPMPQTQSAGSAIGPAVSAMINTAVQAKTFDKMTQEIANLQTQQAQTAAQTQTEKERPALVAAERERATASAFNIRTETAQRAAEMPASRVKGLTAEAIENMPPWLRDNAIRAGFLGNKASDLIAPFVSSAGAVSRFGGF